jgi:anti-sigma regulatory factor (Ser/Thr protein kinase)
MRVLEPASSLQLRLQARPESMPLLRQRLGLWLEELGARKEEVFDVSVAATEAFGNAVEHPQEPRARVIDVQGTIDDRTVTVTVHDYGSWRDERQREEGGYGFPLIRQLVDTVEVETQSEGTAITLQRRLARPALS